jgi:CDP-glycerol glycerophosphotransferase (TagB/SpsB family)
MKVYFDIKHLYYLPQYLPVKAALTSKGIECHFVLYKQQDLQDVMVKYVEQENLNYTFVENSEAAKDFYLREKPCWIIFGHSFENIDQLHQHSKTALMQHGIGPKAYFDSSRSNATIRFVEGQYRLKKLQLRFPNNNFVDTGFAKLDPIINQDQSCISLMELGLDPQKKTILYAPTFYPSSIECLAKGWPSDLDNYNIIIKPHFFSLYKKKLKNHQKCFNLWDKFSNVYMADLNDVSIIPFMTISDVLISDASSTLLEFTALNKPAIWTDFYKLRWSYRGIFSYRYKKRIDVEIEFFAKIAEQVTCYEDMLTTIDDVLQHPDKKESQRLEMTESLVGKVDGKVSQRIAEYLISKG